MNNYFLDEAAGMDWDKIDTSSNTTALQLVHSILGSAAQYATQALVDFDAAVVVDEQKRERSKWPTRFVSGARGAKARAWRQTR